MFYTLKYDTLYGQTNDIEFKENTIINSNTKQSTKIINEKDINKVKWNEYDIDYIIECSGVTQNIIDAKSLIKNKIVKKIFTTFSPDPVDITVALGCNEDELDILNHNIISTSTCDATAISPIFKSLHKYLGIKNGYVTTLHPWLSYQNLMDGPSSSWAVPGEIYHHYALGRSVIGNLIPKPTSAVEVTFKSFKDIDIKNIGSFSYRTPTAIVCSADITLNVNKKTNINDLKNFFYELQKKQNNNIFNNTNEPLVSLDILKSNFSCTIDHRWTNVINNNLIKIVLWYDNEWGYSSRVIDLINLIDNKINEKN